MSSTNFYKSYSAFTIVELLVVIVVIGILAAITIVSYAGISSRATISSLQSDLTNAVTQLKLDQVNSSSSAFPATLALANGGKGISSSSGTTYTYAVSNTTTPQTFCITATKNNISYNITGDGNPQPGICPVLNLDAGNISSYPGTGTTWTDLSGNGNSGTLVGGVSYTTDGGGSLNFDGVNDRVDLSSSKLMGVSGVTMAIWYKTSSTKAYNFLMGKGNLSSGNSQIKVLGMQIYNLHLTFTVSQGDNTGWCSQGNSGPILATDNTWHQVAGTFDLSSQTIKTYVDGVLRYTSTCNQTGDSEGSDILYIGQDSTLWPSGYFSGQLNDALVYNRVLSVSDILQSYNVTKGRFGL